MKTTTLIASFCCLLIAATSAVGQDGTPNLRPEQAQQRGDNATRERMPRAEGQQKRQQGNESRILQHLLKMDDRELGNLRQTIERIEKMTPEEKEQLRERISKYHKMQPEKVDAMREKFEAIPKEQREAMRARWMEMTPEQRTEWREKLKKMSHEERKALFEEQGFVAPPPQQREKNGLRSRRVDGKGSLSKQGPRAVETTENEEN